MFPICFQLSCEVQIWGSLWRFCKSPSQYFSTKQFTENLVPNLTIEISPARQSLSPIELGSLSPIEDHLAPFHFHQLHIISTHNTFRVKLGDRGLGAWGCLGGLGGIYRFIQLHYTTPLGLNLGTGVWGLGDV